jgi:hypothetical protein
VRDAAVLAADDDRQRVALHRSNDDSSGVDSGVAVSRRRKLERRISIFLRRFDAAQDDNIGLQVPSGARIRGVHLAVVAFVLVFAGVIVLVSAARIHDRLTLVAALWIGALLLFAIARNPRRWL